MQIEVVTLFPEMIRDALRFGIVGRAIERGLVRVGTEDPRAHTTDAHRTVDDRPYGGGPGMVLKPEPVLAAIRAAQARLPAGSPRIYLSAQGELFDQRRAQELAALPGLLLLAGRYEGLDERIVTLGVDRELSRRLCVPRWANVVLTACTADPALTPQPSVAVALASKFGLPTRLWPSVTGTSRSSL